MSLVGAKMLAKLPQWPPMLLHLGLNANEIYTSGGLAIVDAVLTRGASVSTLELDGNMFSMEGMEQMGAKCQEADRAELWMELEDNIEEEGEEEGEEDALIQQFERSLNL